MGPLRQEGRDTLVGTTAADGIYNGGSVYALSRSGQPQGPPPRFAISFLYSFTSGVDGAYTLGNVAFGRRGEIFGANGYGGTTNSGNVFMLRPPRGSGEWRLTVLHNFCTAQPCLDGLYPRAGVAVDATGAVYGTTAVGGGNGSFLGYAGSGTLYQLKPPSAPGGDWTYQVLHSFCAQKNCADGVNPQSVLLMLQGGVLIGTASNGGLHGGGTLYRLTPPTAPATDWTLDVLYQFCSLSACADGGDPRFGGVVQGTDGAFYGSTFSGGAANLGTVFRLAPPAQGQSAWTEQVLHNFTGCSATPCDGANPNGSVVFAPSGALWGTTTAGGPNGHGIAFELADQGSGVWEETTVDFSGSHTPSGSEANLLLSREGHHLYGTSVHGGTSNAGTVFSITP